MLLKRRKKVSGSLKLDCVHAPRKPVVVAADHLDRGVVVSFSGGRNVFYSTELLLSMLDQGEVLPDVDWENGSPESE